MLKAANWRNALSSDGSGPFQRRQVENEQIIKPVFPISTAKYKHHVLNNAGRVELSHGRLTSDDGRDIKRQLLNSLFQVYKYHI